MDPDVARHHAHTAALLAYNRGREGNSAEGNNRAGAQQRSSQDNQTSSQQAGSGAEFDRSVKRQQSVRFAGPNAVQRTRSIGSRANGPILQAKSSTATLRPIAMTTNAPVPAAYRPPSRSSSIGKASYARTNAASSMVGDAFDEYYAHEDDLAFNQSSYRRVRKSKSMFISPLRASTVFFTNGSPERQESIHNKDQPTFTRPQTSQAINSPLRAPKLRAPKSMSFLKGGRRRTQPDNNDEAVQLARDRFFQEAAQQRLREQPSFLFRSRAQKQEKAFRQSVRSSSGGFGASIASAGQEQPPKFTGPTIKDAARKASKTISKKFKKIFGRSKEEPIEIPDQQVDARESHVREYNGDPQEDYSNIPHPDEASLSSVAARLPSLHAVNSSQRLRSYAGSVKSHMSDQSDDKSRVTSWTSAGGNTLASQRTHLATDRAQRLSIINEMGTHVPSATFRRPSLDIRSNLPVLPPSILGNSFAGQKQIDSARVYSALMKRLDENSPKHKLEASRKASMDNFTVPGYNPRSRKPIEVSPGSSRTPATIRHVVTEDSVDGRSQRSLSHAHEWVRADSISSANAEKIFGNTGSHLHQWITADPLREARMRDADDVFSPQDPPQDSRARHISISSNKENIPPIEYQLGRTRSTASAISRQPSTKTSYHTVPEDLGITPQEIEIHEEPVVQDKKRLRDSRSAFFGGTSVTISRTTSPYRRAMAEVEYGSLGNEPSSFLSPFARASMYLAPKQTSEKDSGDEETSGKAYTESVYSRTTSGRPGESVLSLPLDSNILAEFPMPTPPGGDAVIVDRSVYRPRQPSSGHRRGNGSTGSNEWKKWMSSEVSKLERAKENTATSPYVNYALPTMPKVFHPGHYRESAQINDDDDMDYLTAQTTKQPLSVIQMPSPNIQNQPILKPILKKQSNMSLTENSEAKFSPRSSKIPVPPPPPPPPVPQRSPLRVMPSKSSLRSQYTLNTPNSTKLAGAATLRSVKSANFTIRSVETPANKLTKKHGISLSAANTPLSTQGDILDNYLEERFGNLTPLSRFRSPRDSHLISSRENMRAEKANRDEKMWSTGNEVYGDPIMAVSRAESVLSLSRPESELGRREITGGKRNSKTEDEAQVGGSRMMVDLFLSSRRRRIAETSEDSSRGLEMGESVGGESPSVFI